MNAPVKQGFPGGSVTYTFPDGTTASYNQLGELSGTTGGMAAKNVRPRASYMDAWIKSAFQGGGDSGGGGGRTLVQRLSGRDGSITDVYSDGTRQTFGGSAAPSLVSTRPTRPTRAARAAQPSPSSPSDGLGYYVSGSPARAFLRSTNKDLGILVGGPGGNQVVKSTAGGKLWALFTLAPDGTVTFDGSYGTVPGAPPPPNAQVQQVVQASQYAPPPPPPPQYYPPPSTQYYPMSVPTPTFGPPPPPEFPMAWPVNPSTLPTIDNVAPYDAQNAALYMGAAYGAEAAAAHAQNQQQLDPLTVSIMMGGGAVSGDLSGMAGGFDPSTLAALSGGDPNAALDMAMSNGGYDPTGGMVDDGSGSGY